MTQNMILVTNVQGVTLCENMEKAKEFALCELQKFTGFNANSFESFWFTIKKYYDLYCEPNDKLIPKKWNIKELDIKEGPHREYELRLNNSGLFFQYKDWDGDYYEGCWEYQSLSLGFIPVSEINTYGNVSVD